METARDQGPAGTHLLLDPVPHVEVLAPPAARTFARKRAIPANQATQRSEWLSE